MLHTRSTSMPRSWGLCRYCLRDMWDGATIPSGKTRVSPDRTQCTTCERWWARYGTDPREAKNSLAEVVPAERPEHDDDWKTDPDRRCADLPTEFFAPELDADDPEFQVMSKHERREMFDTRRVVAAALCGSCPLAAVCRATAQEMGYEGLWGGAWFDRARWEDLVTGERGPTMHAPKRDRDRYAAREAA